MADTKPFAIVNDVKTDHKVIAICEVRTYDVWGNSRDGYEVNDSFVVGREIEIEATAVVHGIPRFPGASDAFRSFPADSASFAVPNVVVSFELADKAIKDVFGVKGAIETDGDDMHYEVTRARDGYPIGSIVIERFKASDEA
jgi:hypothetical protein